MRFEIADDAMTDQLMIDINNSSTPNQTITAASNQVTKTQRICSRYELTPKMNGNRNQTIKYND